MKFLREAGIINRALLKEQIKRFWVVAALPLLAYLLFVLTPIHRSSAYNSQLQSVGNMIDMLRMSNPLVIFSSAAVPFVAALSLFSYQFNPRAAVAFNSYPVNRKQLFFTNLFAGFALMIVPLVIFCILLLIPIRFEWENMESIFLNLPAALFPNGLNRGDVINTLPLVAGFFGRLVITYTFYFSLFTLASVLAGHGVVAALLCMAFPFVPVGVFGLDQAIRYWMVAGHSLNKLGDMLANVLTYSNPAGWFGAFTESFGTANANMMNGMGYLPSRIFSFFSPSPFENGKLPFLVPTYLAGIAVLLAAAYFLNRIRKQERTGESVVFGPFKQVLIFLLSLAGGIIMFVFFLNIFGDRGSMGIAYGGFALGFTVAFFVAQMIAEKTFNVGYKFKAFLKFAAVTAAVYLLLFVSTRLDLNGYQHHVPNPESVSGVYILDLYDDTRLGDTDYASWVTDREIINGTVEAHRSTVADMGALRRTLGYRLMSGRIYREQSIETQNILYRLNSGEIISRTYYLTAPMREDLGWMDLRADERVILSDYTVLTRPDAVKSVHLYYQNNNDSEYREGKDFAIHDKNFASLFEEIKKDIVDMRDFQASQALGSDIPFAVDSASSGYISVTMDLSNEEERAKSTDWTGMYPSYSYPGAQYYLSLNAHSNTLAWLKANGYMK